MWWDRIFGATSGGTEELGPHDADSTGDERIVVEPDDPASATTEVTDGGEEPAPVDSTSSSDVEDGSDGEPPSSADGIGDPDVDVPESTEDGTDRDSLDEDDSAVGTDSWVGEDPISFSEEPEAGALLDAVNVGGAGESDGPGVDELRDDAGADGDPGDVSGARAGPDPTGTDRSADEAADGTDDSAGVDAAGADADTDAETDADTDAEIDAEIDAVDEGTGGADERVEAAASDAARLQSRLDAVEDGHERISETVSDLESEVAEVHERIDGVHEDIEHLVGLVREAAPTRGGATETTSTPSTELSPTAPVATERAATEPGGADRASGDDADDPDEEERTSAEADGEGEGPGAEDERPDVPGPSADPSPRTDGSSAPALDGADPRSDAAAERLRDYQASFGSDESASAVGGTSVEDGPGSDAGSSDGGSTNGAAAAVQTSDPAEDGSDADVLQGAAGEFEFEKVLVPADGDGEPEVIGGVLEPPYLEDIPDGYAEEAAVIEWLDGIVETADEQTAVDALAYYESIGWLGSTVCERLSQYLSGLEHVTEPEPPVGPPEDLDREDHRRSFEYVTRLATGEVEPDGI